jgi:hypothetical protein
MRWGASIPEKPLESKRSRLRPRADCLRFAAFRSFAVSVKLGIVPTGTDLRALHGLISEAELLLTATSLPKAHARRAAQLLRSARIVAEALVENPPVAAKVRKSGPKAARGSPADAQQIAGTEKARAASKPPDLRLPATEMRRLVERVSREVVRLAAQKGA